MRYPAIALGALLTSAAAFAAVSPDQAARLNQDLTPLGAERAGNADGTIPAWTGGITRPPAGYTPGMHHPDPFAGEQPLYVITKTNLDQYRDKLTAGNLALLQAYPDYKLPVYPTHRTAAVPQYAYDATLANATRAQLINDGNGVTGAIIGEPFPIPQNGQEVMWNFLLRYRGVMAMRQVSQAAPTRGGDYTLVNFEEKFLFNYLVPGMTEEKLNNTVFYFMQEVKAPARLAGYILLVHETLDQVKEPRRAWTYNTGQRRVRRAPEVAYDNPGTAADGMRTSDQLDMFNGALDRYTWTLVGKKEMIVPYNSYHLHSDQVKYKDILKPLHINQDLTRYELHRVWVVEAKLKPDTSHIYQRRTFYIDEDSWQVLVVDQYDSRGQLWRVSEAHCINYYEVPCFWSTLEVHTDLLAGRYLAFGLQNEGPAYDYSVKYSAADFSPDTLRREGMR
ncbi:MAG TPA: DUF1329 domain-containing protein [Opitutaceae bacterium]|nr:DUF1329 domain-containing protein [Opitutaceae bacterium]